VPELKSEHEVAQCSYRFGKFCKPIAYPRNYATEVVFIAGIRRSYCNTEMSEVDKLAEVNYRSSSCDMR